VRDYGCYSSDYPSPFPENSIALVKRGNCTFAEKAAIAEPFSPKAVFIFNEGNSVDRMGVFGGSLGDVPFPVIAISYFSGQLLSQSSNITLSFDLATETYTSYSMNVIAETKVGRADRVIVVGSHLDSVAAGPGINDNGSGSSLNIELAIQLATSANQDKIKNKIRFAWWGGEELGLLGSNWYVNHTNKEALANISVNLNFDMIGSPNFIRGIYNGSSDKTSNGSAVVQQLFEAYYASQNLPVILSEFNGRSDYGPFLEVGIPAGGLFTGAEEVKTAVQRAKFGGLAGASYDPCYHQACDTIENINQQVLGEMAKGAAHVLETLATQENLRLFLANGTNEASSSDYYKSLLYSV